MKHKTALFSIITGILLCACGANNSTNAATLSEEAAKNIALQEIPGAAEEHIRLFKQSNDDGIRTYEGTIIYEDNKYDFEIDANDGTILEWDMEPIYD